MQKNKNQMQRGIDAKRQNRYRNVRRKAFTLAEVLITLGIIGIVAAMTLPSLIQEHREKQRVAQLKKAYTILSQAFLMAENEYGDIEGWDFSSTNTGKKDDEGNAVYDYSGTQLVTNRFKEYIKQSGKTEHNFKQYLSLDGRNYSSSVTNGKLTNKNGDKIFLADGTIVSFGWMYEGCSNKYVSCGDIEVFLPEKVARVGISAFWFRLTPDGIIPDGDTADSLSTFKDTCDATNSKGKTSQMQGKGCAAWVIYNENMDYLHCSDLSWSGKKKCK